MRILASLLIAASVFLGTAIIGTTIFTSGTAFATVPAEVELVGPADAHDADAHDAHAVHGAPPVNWTDLGYGDKDVNGEKLTNGAEPMAPPLLFALFNFVVFAGIIYWKAGPALTKYLANRHETIKSALEEAAKLQEEAKEKLAEYSARIKDADSEVNALIEQIRKDAEVEREHIIADAELQAERLRKDAEDRIQTEFLTAKRQLEREIVAKAAEAAERILSEKASPTDHNTLFTNFVADLISGKASESASSESTKGQA